MGKGLIWMLALVATIHFQCEPEWFHRGLSARNDTPGELTFVAEVDGERVRLARAAPGETVTVLDGGALMVGGSRFGSDSCTSVDLVALDEDGKVVARASPPLCMDDDREPDWVVEG